MSCFGTCDLDWYADSEFCLLTISRRSRMIRTWLAATTAFAMMTGVAAAQTPPSSPSVGSSVTTSRGTGVVTGTMGSTATTTIPGSGSYHEQREWHEHGDYSGPPPRGDWHPAVGHFPQHSWRTSYMNLIVLIIILMLVFGGGGFYIGGPYVGGGLGTVLLIVLIVLLVRG
jgi:hypothetical protein